ncbi:hypothetical protein LY76DRAFT_142074 [Colletotrichum caudatum]|nr:hypothetical protein LY76DRAFT_142074 [Colletotrichum caudatum]
MVEYALLSLPPPGFFFTQSLLFFRTDAPENCSEHGGRSKTALKSLFIFVELGGRKETDTGRVVLGGSRCRHPLLTILSRLLRFLRFHQSGQLQSLGAIWRCNLEYRRAASGSLQAGGEALSTPGAATSVLWWHAIKDLCNYADNDIDAD